MCGRLLVGWTLKYHEPQHCFQIITCSKLNDRTKIDVKEKYNPQEIWTKTSCIIDYRAVFIGFVLKKKKQSSIKD